IKYIGPISLKREEYVEFERSYNGAESDGNAGIGGGPYPSGDDGGGAISYSNITYWGNDNPAGFGFPVNSADLGSPHRVLAGTFNFTSSCPAPPATLITVLPITAPTKVNSDHDRKNIV